jgi:hypothetical protein
MLQNQLSSSIAHYSTTKIHLQDAIFKLLVVSYLLGGLFADLVDRSYFCSNCFLHPFGCHKNLLIASYNNPLNVIKVFLNHWKFN